MIFVIRNTHHNINRPDPRALRKHQNEILVLRWVNRIHKDVVPRSCWRVNPDVRGLRGGFQSRNAEDVGAVNGGCPDQLDTFTQVGDVLAVAGFQFHDIDHFPVAILAGVEGITFETAIG